MLTGLACTNAGALISAQTYDNCPCSSLVNLLILSWADTLLLHRVQWRNSTKFLEDKNKKDLTNKKKENTKWRAQEKD